MIDYIKILRIVLNKINDTIKLHTDELNNNKFEPKKDPKLRKPICIHKILYHVGIIATLPSFFIMFIHLLALDDKTITNIIHDSIFIYLCPILIVGIILLSIDLKIYNNINETICEMVQQNDSFIYNTKQNITITKTKKLLKDFTNEEIDDEDIKSLINYNYYGSSNIPVKGNLYDIPIKTMLQKANVKSIQNLYKNIYFLYKYYLNNYVEDNEYTWITKQLNAFYNSEVTEDIDNIELLKNLKKLNRRQSNGYCIRVRISCIKLIKFCTT